MTLPMAQLGKHITEGEIDTVLFVVVDMQGRLQGKSLDARYFWSDVRVKGGQICGVVLATDVEMNIVDGYALGALDNGFGDIELTADPDSVRVLPWQQKTALVLADPRGPDGREVAASPRQILRVQLARLADRGLTALAGTELEACVYQDSYVSAWQQGYRELRPASDYARDYGTLDTGGFDPLLRRIRIAMAGAGMAVAGTVPECNLGQFELTFRPADPLTTCDNHVIVKHGAKEIAAAAGRSLTFMAKPNEREGNSCHLHLSLRDLVTGHPVFPGDQRHGFSRTMANFLAGQLACLPDFMLWYAPNVNSYKRFRPGWFAPVDVSWGLDNRTCALRVVGSGDALRVENRVPGGDVHPHLALAAMIAAGIHGIDNDLALPPPERGNAYLAPDAGSRKRLPVSLRDAARRWQDSKPAELAFGAEVVEHYARAAAVELAAFDSAITDWELRRGFERL